MLGLVSGFFVRRGGFTRAARRHCMIAVRNVRLLPCDKIRFEPVPAIAYPHRRLRETEFSVAQPTPQTHISDRISRADLRAAQKTTRRSRLGVVT
jgi:hypothetical protein